jgi:hypothetical protein
MKIQSSLKFTAVLGLALSGSMVACGGASNSVDEGSGGKGGSKASGGSGASNSGGKGGSSGSGGGAGSKGSGGSGSGGSGSGGSGSGGSGSGGSGGVPDVKADLKDGLVGYWPFEEGQGNMVKDMSGKGNDGVAVEGLIQAAPIRQTVSWVAGKKGKAMQLDGINDWVKVPRSDSIDSTGTSGAASLAAWVNMKQFGQASSNSQFNFFITRQEVGTAFDHYGLAVREGKPTACIHFFFATAAETIKTGDWVHLAMTYDGITATIYIDGVSSATTDIGWPLAADTTDVVIGAGQNIDVLKEFVDGTIDEVYMYNRALSQTDVVALMKAAN